MPKISASYQKLIAQICDQVVNNFKNYRFTHNGQTYVFASSALLKDIREKVKELLELVPLTSDEETALENLADDNSMDILASAIRGFIGDSIVGELPTEKNTVDLSGITRLVFNAARYNYPLIARLSLRNSDDVEIATYDTLASMRLKDITAELHAALAKNVSLPGLTVLLRILRYDFNHPINMILRKEEGAHLATRPMTFVAQLAGKTQPMMGNTRTWHATVVAVMMIAQERVRAQLQQADEGQRQQFLADNKDLLALVSGNVPTRGDENFMVALRDDLRKFFREGISAQSGNELNGSVVELARPSTPN